jgi:hypothetical protein
MPFKAVILVLTAIIFFTRVEYNIHSKKCSKLAKGANCVVTKKVQR